MRCVAPWARRPRCLPFVTLIIRPFSRYHSSSSINTLTSSKASTEFILPTTSQLLRFSITASSRVGDNYQSQTIRSQVVSLLDADWNLGPPAALWLPLKGVQPINQRQGTLLLSSVVDVAALKSIVERMVIHSEGAARLQVNNCIVLGNALQRCQSYNTYSEIVAVLSEEP